MEPITIATAIVTIFFTKALEKTGEKFGEATLTKTRDAIAKIREHSPEIAGQLESGDREVLSLGKAVLESLPIDPIFAEMAAAADAEENAILKAKMNEESTRKIVQVMAIDLEGSSLKVKSMRQKAPAGSGNVEQTMLKNVKITGDIYLGDLSQEA